MGSYTRIDFSSQLVRDASSKAGLDDRLAKEVARGLFKLMAYKDQYEVARLYCDPEFKQALESTFAGATIGSSITLPRRCWRSGPVTATSSSGSSARRCDTPSPCLPG